MELKTDSLSTGPKPVFLPRSSRFVVGLDLGQSTDPTAIAVLEKKIGVIDSGSDADRHCGLTHSCRSLPHALRLDTWNGCHLA